MSIEDDMSEFLNDVLTTASAIGFLVLSLWSFLFMDACTTQPVSSSSLSSLELPPKNTSPEILVMLKKFEQKDNLTIRSSAPLTLESDGRAVPKQVSSGHALKISVYDNHLSINGKTISGNRLHIHPTQSYASSAKRPPVLNIQKRPYRGSLLIKPHTNQGLRVINKLNITTYLWSVLGSEMQSDHPGEALKTQAVAARTYALWEKNRTSKRHSEYDVDDTVASQVYKGVRSETRSTRHAVNATKGEVLMQSSGLLPAFFHSTCGGKTTSAARVIPHYNPKTVPTALMGNVSCPWDQHSKYYSWETSISKNNLERALLSDKTSSTSIKDINILNRDKSDRVQNLLIALSHNRSQKITGTSFRRNTHNYGIKSTNFVVQKQGDSFHFEGHGWGHGAGLCQMGAIGAAREGLTYRSILNHYYPGATIYKLYRSARSRDASNLK